MDVNPYIKALFNRYKHQLRDTELPIIRYGGWAQILKELFEQTEWYMSVYEVPAFVWDQIVIRDGQLRCYFSGRLMPEKFVKEMLQLISEMEEKALHTCFLSGNPGELCFLPADSKWVILEPEAATKFKALALSTFRPVQSN